MPSPVSRLTGDSATLPAGLARHSADSTFSPNAESPVPYARSVLSWLAVKTADVTGGPPWGAGPDRGSGLVALQAVAPATRTAASKAVVSAVTGRRNAVMPVGRRSGGPGSPRYLVSTLSGEQGALRGVAGQADRQAEDSDVTQGNVAQPAGDGQRDDDLEQRERGDRRGQS
jgi:hypothetical protein